MRKVSTFHGHAINVTMITPPHGNPRQSQEHSFTVVAFLATCTRTYHSLSFAPLVGHGRRMKEEKEKKKPRQVLQTVVMTRKK